VGLLLKKFETVWSPQQGVSFVAGKKVQVPYNGKMVTGTEVQVTETIERWTEVTLEDGTRLRLKSAVMTGVRIDGEYDPEGNPVYVLNAAPVLAMIEAPDKLKKKK
jgi:hypothetical protein